MRNKREKVIAICSNCFKEFETNSYEINRGKGKCCSISCAASLSSKNRDQKGSSNNNWKGGIASYATRKRRYRQRYPDKHLAHMMVRNAIRKGDLVRKPCEVCGNTKTEGHHDDYALPLSVRWLCKKHHIDVHKVKLANR